LKDNGNYKYIKGNIEMFDVSNFFMSPYWRNSLYLNGEFKMKRNDDQYIITQDNAFVKLKT